MAELDNARIATGTVTYLRSDNAEQLLQGLFVLQVAEHDATRVGAVILRAGDEGFYIFFQCLCLGEGRSDSFVHDQRDGHVGKHGVAVVCSTAQMVEFLTVSHCLRFFFNWTFSKSITPCPVCTLKYRFQTTDSDPRANHQALRAISYRSCGTSGGRSCCTVPGRRACRHRQPSSS